MNQPGHYSQAHVIAEAEYDDGRVDRVNASVRIADCNQPIHLIFNCRTPEDMVNALYKARLLAEVLTEFADALEGADGFDQGQRP